MRRVILTASAGAILLGTVACSSDDGDNSAAGDGDGSATAGDGDSDLMSGDGDVGTGTGGVIVGTGGQVGGDGDGNGGGNGDGDSEPVCMGQMCGGECIDTQTDNMNCGDCGELCDAMQECQAGACIQVSCVPELDLCSGECISTVENNNHCGDCGVKCGSSEICEESTCIDYCQPTESWDAGWSTLEEEVLKFVNEYRASGYNCDSEGNFGSTGPLAMDPALRCAARMHSRDMARKDYFSHTNLDGVGPGPRMDAAGYDGRGWGENISAGRASAKDTVDGWMESDGHCANIMSPDFTLIGVGYFPGDGAQYGHYWTQTFGRD